jgi:hypothetical protein
MTMKHLFVDMNILILWVVENHDFFQESKYIVHNFHPNEKTIPCISNLKLYHGGNRKGDNESFSLLEKVTRHWPTRAHYWLVFFLMKFFLRENLSFWPLLRAHLLSKHRFVEYKNKCVGNNKCVQKFAQYHWKSSHAFILRVVFCHYVWIAS